MRERKRHKHSVRPTPWRFQAIRGVTRSTQASAWRHMAQGISARVGDF